MRSCIWDHGPCTAPDTVCPHWIGIYCELDEAFGIEMDEIEEELVKACIGILEDLDIPYENTPGKFIIGEDMFKGE